MLYIFLTLVLYSAIVMIAAFASRAWNPTMVTAVSNVIAAIIPVIIAVPLLSNKTITGQKGGWILAILFGILGAMFSLFLNKAYTLNKVAIVLPLVFGGSIFITAVLSAIFFKEKISYMQAIGLILLAFGLSCRIYARFTGK